MNLINQLLASGGIVALILGLMVFEACLLIPYYQRTGKGIAPRELLLTLAAGGSLVLAMGAVMLAAPLRWVGMALGLALVTHVADICFRWRTSGQLAVSEPVLLSPSSTLGPAATAVAATTQQQRRGTIPVFSIRSEVK